MFVVEQKCQPSSSDLCCDWGTSYSVIHWCRERARFERHQEFCLHGAQSTNQLLQSLEGAKILTPLSEVHPNKDSTFFHHIFHMLEKLNLETVTHIEVDGESGFKYLFLAFGVAIRGFRYMRKVVGIDGTFLKGQYRGILLVATT